jgi:hypothetical protein
MSDKRHTNMSEQIPIAVTDQIVRQQERINELENAIVNIHRWTGSKRCAQECKRVIPDVSTRAAAMPNVALCDPSHGRAGKPENL